MAGLSGRPPTRDGVGGPNRNVDADAEEEADAGTGGPGRGSDRDRGQLLLLGAVATAVVFVSLAVVLNGGFHTAVVAADTPEDTDADGAVLVRESVRADAGHLLERSVASHPRDETAQIDAFEGAIDTASDGYARYGAREDRIVRTAVDPGHAATVEGTWIAQTASGRLSYDDDGDGNREAGITLADDVRARNVSVTIQDTNGTTRLVFDPDDPSEPSAYVEIRSGAGRIEVAGSAASGTCGAPTPATVDVSAATVGGDGCPAIDFRGLDRYAVRIEDGIHAEGTYRLTVDGDDALTGTPSRIETRDRLYSAAVELRQVGPTIEYEGVLRIAPGEL